MGRKLNIEKSKKKINPCLDLLYITRGDNGTEFVLRCKNCNRTLTRKDYKLGRLCWCSHPRHKLNRDNPQWQGVGLLSKEFYEHYKAKAEKRGIGFNVSMDYLWCIYLEQGGLCSLSGKPIPFHKKSNDSSGRASLDRIDSTIDYIEGNVQWVDKDIQMSKWKFSQQHYLEICKNVTKYQDSMCGISS